MVETYYILGLKDEARKYAKLLGYNYQSSKWYEKTYIIFNKNYEKINKNNNLENKNKNKKSIINKIKSLIDWDEKRKNSRRIQ